MNYFLFLFAIVTAATVAGAPQIMWARNNYPLSRSWLLIRALSSFSGGAILSSVLFFREYTGFNFVLMVLAFGSIFVVLLMFIFPYNLRHVIPPRPQSDAQDDMR